MGNKTAKEGLQDVTKRTEERVGKITVSGRYHRTPKKLEDDYVLETKVLGSGYNGSVHLAKDKRTNVKYAVKGFKLHGVNREKKEELETECEIFLSMDHPHVARLTDVYESEDVLSLVMECMEGGELFHRVTEKRRFSEKDAAEAAHQMLLAVNYIHTHNIVHRDIKLENFLYETKEGSHLKLIDFGFSKIWEPNTKMALSCGTLAYVAPEVLDKSYTNKCDLWSLGVVIFILLVGYMPFAGSESHQVQMIKAGKCTFRKESWAKVSKEASEFVSKLLEKNPTKRLSAEQALQEDWIKRRTHIPDPEQVDQDTMKALTDFAQASLFRRACMSVMAWSLTAEDRAQVRQAFLELDTSNTGVITAGQFKKVMQERFHIEDDKIKAAFDALDTTHSEEIHYSDFLAAMVSSRIQVHDEVLAQTFRRFDTDNTGYITTVNLKEILGESFEGEDTDKLIAEAHVGHDGKISYQEFIEYLKHPESDDAHQDAAHKVIDNQLKKNPTGSNSGNTPQTGSSNRSVGPKPLRQRTGVGGSGGGAASKREDVKQQKCCSLQ
jgi:calcium-dependent protein kinase